MKIILLAGKARSGKGEVGKILKQLWNQKQEKTVLTEYSKYLKLYAKEMTDWDGFEKNKPRKFLQEMGTYIRQNLNHPDFLIDRMKEDIKIYEKFFDNVVITDVRFPKEIEEIKKTYPKTYAIYIINEHRIDDLTPSEKDHETEHALDDYHEFDYVIVNDTQKELKEKLADIISNLERE